MKVISSCLPRKVELGDGPGRRHAEHQVERHGDRRRQQRQADGGHRIGLDQRRQVYAPSPCATPRRTPRTSGSSRKITKKPSDSVSTTRLDPARIARRRVRLEARRAGAHAGRYGARCRHQAPLPDRRDGPLLQAVDDQQQHERHHQHHGGHRGRAGVVVLLELGDDDQRRDLRHHRQVAGDEDHRAVFADRARERQREARQQRRRQASAAPRAARSASGGRRGWRPPPRSRYRGPPAPAARCAPRTAGR